MSVKYDADIIVAFAARLYKQASSIVAAYKVLGALLGLLGGGAAAALVRQENSMVMLAAVGALIAGAVGYIRGQERAFTLRLNAQTALCQVQIEQNTRQR